MIGATYKLTPNLTLYGDFAEANRAPTPLELACADPVRPCLIDNALVGDPNLQQVVSYTFEGGLRGQFNIAQGTAELDCRRLSRAQHQRHSSPFSSPLIGHQFFQNAGNTLRQGIEANVTYKQDRWNIYANYTYVDATFQNALTLQSPFNPFADANGNIFVVPGDHLPGIPDFRFKLGGEYQITNPWKFGADLNVIGSQWLVGDQSNQNPKLPRLLGREPAFLLQGHGERRGIRARAQSLRSALLRVWNVLRRHFISLSESDRPADLCSGHAVCGLCGSARHASNNRTGIRSRCLAAAGYENVARRLDRGYIACC